MGSLIGHVAPGLGFFLIGLWHLFNHIKLHALSPSSYTAPPWFPASKFRHSELYFIMVGSTASIVIELFVSPDHHQPLDVDGTIPSNHLHTFEHSSISLSLLVYAALVVLLDRISAKIPHHGLIYFLASVTFAEELLLFHLHSTDHNGPEGQYHFFLQLVIYVSLVTTIMGIGFPNSFMVSFVRSLSIFLQGVWFMVMGFMLWTPQFLPKGCFLHDEDGRKVARCSGDEALYRAKSLINLEFSWFLILTAVFGVFFYLFLLKIYGEKVHYFSLSRKEEKGEGDSYDIESQKTIII